VTTSDESVSPPFHCDESGFVRGFAHHDGYLEGVLTDDVAKEAHLAIRSTSGERRVLTLRGVTALDVSGFREGNIIQNLRMWSAAKAAGDPEVRRSLDERLYLDATKLPPNASVFILESSFGANLIAVCAELFVSEVGTTLGPRS